MKTVESVHRLRVIRNRLSFLAEVADTGIPHIHIFRLLAEGHGGYRGRHGAAIFLRHYRQVIRRYSAPDALPPICDIVGRIILLSVRINVYGHGGVLDCFYPEQSFASLLSVILYCLLQGCMLFAGARHNDRYRFRVRRVWDQRVPFQRFELLRFASTAQGSTSIPVLTALACTR